MARDNIQELWAATVIRQESNNYVIDCCLQGHKGLAGEPGKDGQPGEKVQAVSFSNTLCALKEMSIKNNLRCEWFDCSPLTASFDYLCSWNWINLFLLALFGTGGSWSRRPPGGSRTHGRWCKEATVVPQVTVGLIHMRVRERKWRHLKGLFFFLVILGAKRTNWIPRKSGREGRQSQLNQTE